MLKAQRPRVQGDKLPMSQNQTSTKILALILIISAICGGAFAGVSYAAFNAYVTPPPTTTKVTPQTFGTPLWLVTMNDTTTLRRANVAYLNSQNNGQAMIVQVYANLTGTVELTAKVNQTAAFLKFTNSTVGDIMLTALTSENVTEELAFYVPWGFWYCINTTGTVGTDYTIVKWMESIPPTGFGQIIAATILNVRRFF